MATVDVLIPTHNRPLELTLTLAGVAQQTHPDLRVVVAEQSSSSVRNEPAVLTARRLIEQRGGTVEWHTREPKHGIAEQRDFLVNRARSRYALMLDDDIYMEPWVVERLLEALQREGCGFVGAFPAGLSFLGDVRPQQLAKLEFWEGPVQAEQIDPHSPAWQRAEFHAAANVLHALPDGDSASEPRLYKVAWLGACVLYDVDKLRAVGGFSFWPELPLHHAGEEVLVQNLLLRRWGGAGMLPSGTYHQEAPTTIAEEGRKPEANAIVLLPQLLERYGPAATDAG